MNSNLLIPTFFFSKFHDIKDVEKDFDIAKLFYWYKYISSLFNPPSIFLGLLLWPYIFFQLIYSSHPKRNFDWKCPWSIDSVSGLHFNQVMAWRWMKSCLWKHFLTLPCANLLHCTYMATSIIMQQNHWSALLPRRYFVYFFSEVHLKKIFFLWSL